MTGQAFFVLTALADGPRHGYGIVREVEELSRGRVKLKIGACRGWTGAAEGLMEPDREEAQTAGCAAITGLPGTGGARWPRRPSSAPPPPGWCGRGWAWPLRRRPDERRRDLERRPAGAAAAARLVPGQLWEEDMVAAFLDGWLTGDPDADEYIIGCCRPEWPEVASVAAAVRLYLGAAGAPRRYFAWGQE